MTGTVVNLEDMANDPKINDVLKAAISEMFKMDEEMSVVVDCPYAQYVEFGSDPTTVDSKAPKVQDDICGDKVTQTNLNIRDWLTKKYMLTPEQRKERGDKLYKKIMDEGMQATPFMRPAKYVVEEDLKVHPDKYLRPNTSFSENIAHEMKVQMENALMQNESLVSGDLLGSIRVVKKSEVEGQPMPDDMRQITPEIWDDYHLDRHGNVIKPKKH